MKNSTKIFSAKLFTIACGLFLGLSGNIASAQTYCTPSYSSGCGGGDDIKDVILNGGNGTMISNLNTPCPASSYQDYTTSTLANITATLIMGSTYSGNVTTNYTFAGESVKVWIDFNQNGTFETSEVVATLSAINNVSTGAISVAIPFTALAGNTRMRVRLNYTSSATGIEPCNSVTWGECHDYKVTILPPAPPNNAGVGSLVTPDPTPFCSNSFREVSVSVINLGSNALNNATVKWSVDGVMKPDINFTTPLPNYKDSATVVLGTVLFPTSAPLAIKAWTEMPNNVTDADFSDDTLNVFPAATMQGVDIAMAFHDSTICEDGSVVLDAGSFPLDPIYIWSTGALTPTIDVDQPGTYTVKVQNNIGCFDRDTVNISVHPFPVANSIAIIDNGDCSFTFNVIGAQNADTYTWDFGDNTGASGDGSKTHSYSGNGTYNATLTLSNQCGEITITRVIQCMTGATGVNNLSGLNAALKMYPNPSKDKVTISNKSSIKMSGIEIYNVIGQKVYSVKAGTDTLDINIESLATGIYNVIINTDQGKVTKKLEVIK